MTVNLTKGQAISLQKSDGGTLTAVRMGLGWQAAPRRGLFGTRTREIDLDASAVLFADKQPVDVVFFRHLVSDDGSVKHTGDNLVGGAGQGGDDEAIMVDLQRVPVHIDQIVFTVNSFTGPDLRRGARTPSAAWSTRPTARSWPATPSPAAATTPRRSWPRCTAQGSGWQMTAIGDAGQRPHLPGPDAGDPAAPVTGAGGGRSGTTEHRHDATRGGRRR